MEILEYIGMALILIGGIFLFLGALGIFRMPDIYTRLQAGTKASTLGAMSTILGVGFLHPDWFLKPRFLSNLFLPILMRLTISSPSCGKIETS